MRSSVALVFILILTVSPLMMVKPAWAQTQPSVPTFTVHLAGPSITVNTTYSLNPNTGQIVANIGYTNKYSYVILTIKNQPFNPSYGSLYYNIQIKNKNTPYENWTVVSWDGLNPAQTTDSEYTNISLGVEGQWGVPSLAGTQTDIQVEAMLGNFGYGHSNPPITSGFIFTGMTSGWSNTQTVSIPANIPLSPTTTPSSSSLTPSPTVPEFPAWIVLLLAMATASLVVLAAKGKQRNQSPPNQTE